MTGEALEPPTVPASTAIVAPPQWRGWIEPDTRLRATVRYAYYQLVRTGPAGMAGVAASIAAAIIGFTTLMSVRSATDALIAQIAHAQQRPSVEENTEERLGRVVATLPTRGQIPVVIGEVLQQARDAGVALERGQYVYSPPRTGGVGRYELEFPVKAGYPNVRNFIDRTLAAVPAVGVDKLRIERKAVGDVVVNADLRFVVFVRNE